LGFMAEISAHVRELHHVDVFKMIYS
jgi:hypothetical protein